MSEAGKLLKKANQKLSLLLEKNEMQLWQSRLEQVWQMPGASLKFKRIANVPDREQLYDYLAEIRYALVFTRIGFQVQLEPLGEEGPDLGISRDGHSAVVEVKRFRQVDPDPPKNSLSDKEFLDDTFLLEPYGDPERDIKKIISRIAEKFKQLGNRESIIAVWNDDEKDIESEHALSELRNDVGQQRLSLPTGLLFVLYGSDWQRPRQQFYCFPLRILGTPQSNWMQELESSFVYTLM
ncbi:MAG: hypothetical protein ABIK32_07170 [Chloroflexota bacterium]|nr:hypothetical protein [Chloroflexota bacterium]